MATPSAHMPGLAWLGWDTHDGTLQHTLPLGSTGLGRGAAPRRHTTHTHRRLLRHLGAETDRLTSRKTERKISRRDYVAAWPLPNFRRGSRRKLTPPSQVRGNCTASAWLSDLPAVSRSVLQCCGTLCPCGAIADGIMLGMGQSQVPTANVIEEATTVLLLARPAGQRLLDPVESRSATGPPRLQP